MYILNILKLKNKHWYINVAFSDIQWHVYTDINDALKTYLWIKSYFKNIKMLFKNDEKINKFLVLINNLLIIKISNVQLNNVNKGIIL